MTAAPPPWAEALLRLVVTPSTFESVSGDLLEEYREAIHPVRGRVAADAWYVVQVLGFVVRSAAVWAVLLAAAFLVRTALDWLAPPENLDFSFRAQVSTFSGIGLLSASGFWASRRYRSVLAGTCVGIAVAAIAAVISITGAAALLAISHDDATMGAIGVSGGLGEVFELPILMVVPGAVLGTMGGALAAAIRPLFSTS